MKLGSKINPNALSEDMEKYIDWANSYYEEDDKCGWATGDYELTDCGHVQLKFIRAQLVQLKRMDNPRIYIPDYNVDVVDWLYEEINRVMRNKLLR